MPYLSRSELLYGPTDSYLLLNHKQRISWQEVRVSQLASIAHRSSHEEIGLANANAALKSLLRRGL